MPQLLSRTELFVAAFLPRPRQGPRRQSQRDRRADRAASSGRASASATTQTETVAWLVRHHLRDEPDFAFKRDIEDPKTISDFVADDPVAGAAAPAPGADRGRHPRRRPDGLERLEGPAAARALPRGRRGDGGGRSAGGRRQRADRARPRRRWPRRSASDPNGGRRPRSRPSLERHDPRYWLGFDPRGASPPRQPGPPRRGGRGSRSAVDFTVDALPGADRDARSTPPTIPASS